MKPLTKIQSKILNYVKSYINKFGYSPKIREIRDYMGYKSDNAAKEHLDAIKKKGYINTTPNVARSIVVLTKNNGWISINDKLPENRKEVIASNCEEVRELYFNNDKFNHPYDCKMDEYDIEFIKSITHWMPLPQPPSI